MQSALEVVQVAPSQFGASDGLNWSGMSENNELNVIGKRVGNYIVERSLASGGMGMVFVAKHPALGRQVAVKFLGREDDVPPDHAKRFLDEACITASLHHPNIVDIFDFGELDGRLYYVMELLEGQDLAGVIRSKRIFPVDEIQVFLDQICAGLEAAHAVGIVHRDLKPSNIFVLRGQPTRLKLMDFGVAKVMSASGDRTRQGQIIGTPRYMSPEQALGQIDQITPRSDIYSLGVIIYELLTGTSVFEHNSPMMLLVMHIRDAVPPIRDRNSEIPPALAELVEACLAKNPNERPQSASEIALRFRQTLREAPICQQRLSRDQDPAVDRTSLPPTVSVTASAAVAESETRLQALPAVKSNIIPPLLIAEPITAESEPTSHLTQDEDSPKSSPDSATPPVADNPESISPSVPVVLVAPESISPSMPVPVSPDSISSSVPVPVPAEVEVLSPNGAAPNSLRLTKTDRTTLNRLWLKMQRGGDFPAFVRNVGEVSKRADFESTFSATQLGDSILKDYALTAKLLRVVNSAYAARFGGKVYSIQHAIVILGFDRVRSLALSISLFKNRGSDEHAKRVSESAINSLVSGEITQHLAPYAHVTDEEQAMMCGMFRNLGRHLAIVYLPELYEQVMALVQANGVSLHTAAERILGLSFQKLGIGIAERWRLPKPILRTMSSIPGFTGHCAREEDRIVELADFSNELCDIVVTMTLQQRAQAITNLLVRHKTLLTIDQDELAELLQSVQLSFEQRYASLLGLDAKNSRFSRNVTTLVSDPEGIAKDETMERANQAQISEVLAAEAVGMGRNQLPVSARTRPARARPQAQRIQLAKVNVSDAEVGTIGQSPVIGNAGCPIDRVKEIANELSTALEREGRSDRLLNRILTVLAEHLGQARLLVLKSNGGKGELIVAGGVRDDLDALVKEFRIPLAPARASVDVFSQAFHQSRDVIVDDTYGVRASAVVPLRYYETIGAPTFALYSCTSKGVAAAVILIDVESPSQLPSQERLLAIAPLRPILARAVA